MFAISKKLSPIFLLAILFAVSACSSSQTESDTTETAPALEVDSSADQVGSIPEDMLAADEAATDSTTQTDQAPAADGATATTEEAGADPFKDLKEKEGESKETLATTESESTSSSESATTGETRTYKVKAGDTLMKIAFSIYGDIDRWKDLQSWNSDVLKGSKQLSRGMKLKYEAPSEEFSPEKLAHSYTIKKGDTLANIADDVYGKKSKYRKLQNYNKKLIKNPNRIFAGFTIYYDITEQEMAEAEARRQQKMAAGGYSAPSEVPSSLNPPAVNASPQPIAVAPTPAPANLTPPPPPLPAAGGLADPSAPTSAVGQPTAAGQ